MSHLKKPTAITLDTLPDLFAYWRSQAGGLRMGPDPDPQGGDNPPERPEGVSEEEWSALGDPGRAVLQRERQARQEAERALSLSRQLAAQNARPTPPKAPTVTPKQREQQPSDSGSNESREQPDVAALVQQAVEAAIKPFQEREQQREADQAAGVIRDAVLNAAKDRLHDATDALSIDLTTVTDGNGAPDADKIKAALDKLAADKPHLVKPGTRFAQQPGVGQSAPADSVDEQVKVALARMQASSGVRVSQNTN